MAAEERAGTRRPESAVRTRPSPSPRRATASRQPRVGAQLPVALDDRSEPEPDLVVVPGAPWDYADAHPSTPLLLVEIAETSLALDRRHKAGLYARAGIADYWIVNLVDLLLEVSREPVASGAARAGWEYASVQVLTRGAAVSLLAAPGARIAVTDLLPPA